MDAATDDVGTVVADMTHGDGVDAVFDCAGTPVTVDQSLKMVHRGGKIDVVGVTFEPLSINSIDLVMGDVTLIGCGLKFDIPGAVDLLDSGDVKVGDLVTHEYPLSKLTEAFHTQKTGQDAIKVQVVP